jgi:hypothetical protein
VNGLFDTCMICGRRSRKEGEGLCLTHETEGLIALSYERMRESIKREGRRLITRFQSKHLRMSDVREIK